MEKKTILVVVILFITITTVFAQTAADFSVELTSDSNGVIIKGYTGRALTVTVPDTIEGLPVKEIGRQAFGFDGRITSIILPQGLVKIGEEAFQYQSYLTSINIPNSVTEIGDKAFYRCTSLKSINIPDSVTSLGRESFSASGLETFILGQGITIIPRGTFIQCKLISIIIPEGVIEIGNDAFRENSTLTSITLPSTIKKIGSNAFGRCGLITVIIPDSVETIEFGTEFSSDVFSGCSRLNLASQSALRRRGYTGYF